MRYLIPLAVVSCLAACSTASNVVRAEGPAVLACVPPAIAALAACYQRHDDPCMAVAVADLVVCMSQHQAPSPASSPASSSGSEAHASAHDTGESALILRTSTSPPAAGPGIGAAMIDDSAVHRIARWADKHQSQGLKALALIALQPDDNHPHRDLARTSLERWLGDHERWLAADDQVEDLTPTLVARQRERTVELASVVARGARSPVTNYVPRAAASPRRSAGNRAPLDVEI